MTQPSPPPQNFPPSDFAVIRSAGTICRWNGHYWIWYGGDWVDRGPIPVPTVSDPVCWHCDQPGIQYQAFSGGREYYCPTCEDVFPYREGQAPRRVQMLADGQFDELRAEVTATAPPTREDT